MKKLLLLRHVQTEGNVRLEYVGKKDSPISEYGKKQLSFLENKFKNIGLDRVYSSSSERAILTAKSFYKDVIIEDSFREIDFGMFEGLTHDEIKKLYPQEIERQRLEKDGFRFPDGDSLDSFYKRVSRGLEKIVEQMNEGETVAIVTHGGVVRLMLSHLISRSKDQFWRFYIDNASTSTIFIEDGYSVIHGVNEKLTEVE
ncbi:MAG: histidine phosphatase family protein [Filifactoraceae bacterium]